MSAMSQTFRFDASQVSSRLAQLEGCLPKIAERAMALAALRLLRDSIMEMPTVPRETGTLRGSGSVVVQNKHFMSADPVGGSPTPATAGDAQIGPGEIVAVANGDATSHMPFKANEMRAFNGLCLVILTILA